MSGHALSVTARPYADLQVASVNGPPKLRSGDLATVTWRTQNFGSAATASMAWHDAVYLSSDALLDASDTRLGSVRNSDFLGVGEWYDQSLEVTIPSNVPLGSYYLLVKTDDSNDEQEFDLEGNNVGATPAPIDLVTPGPPVLTVTNVIPPATIEPGGRPVVTWTITNTGDSTITEGWSGGTGWDDGLALSRDPIYNENEDFFLGSHTYWHGLPLRPGESYTSTGTAERTVPNWEPGVYYLIVLPDTHFGAGSGFGQSQIARNPGAQEVILTLSQPPDLVIANVDPPAAAASGQEAWVGWTVENQGTGRTHSASWTDGVYLSLDSNLDPGDVLIGAVEHRGELWSGERYVQSSVSVDIPRGLSGDYYLIVQTDTGGDVREANDANNAASSAAAFPIALIESDLVPAIDAAPAEARARQTIVITRTVRNDGPDATFLGQWTDTFYLSEDDALDREEDIKIGDILYTGGPLAPGAAYTLEHSLPIETGVEGTYYLFLATDSADALYEHNGEGNNTAAAAEQILIQDLAPDLNVLFFEAPPTAVAGQALALAGQVQNDGMDAAQGVWRDAVYLSSDLALDKDSDILLAQFERSQEVGVGASYEPQGSPFEVVLPDGIEGDYYLFLVVDNEGALYEKDQVANNVAVSSLIAVTDLKPDLKVEDATAPGAGLANSLIEVDFLIANRGQEAAKGGWTDAFYLSEDTVFDPAVDRLFGVFRRSEDLAVGGEYGPAASPARVRLPDRIEGLYHIFVVPDYLNQVPEVAEGEAYRLPNAIDIAYQGADLQVASVAAPATAKAGSAITVSWRVANSGEARTAEASWQDGVYLSKDTTFEPASDIELGLVARAGRLNAGESYDVTKSFTLRQDVEGTYYVYVVTDARRQVYEHGLDGNNTKAAKPTRIGGLVVDLQITALSAPPPAVAGQDVQVDWSVTNAGRDATGAASWVDRVYLSENDTLDEEATLLGSRRRDGVLVSGATYDASLNVSLPAGAAGNRFIIVKTDAAPRNDVYERNAENNNTAAFAVVVDYAPSPDLQVASVTAPATALSGQDLRVEWTVSNEGQAVARSERGGWYDTVYLSRDPYVDQDTDLRLGSVLYSGTLAPGEPYADPQSITVRLPSGLSGPYYVLVATDSNRRVDEAGEEHNNTGAAPGLLQVSLAPPADLTVSDVDVPAERGLR